MGKNPVTEKKLFQAIKDNLDKRSQYATLILGEIMDEYGIMYSSMVTALRRMERKGYIYLTNRPRRIKSDEPLIVELLNEDPEPYRSKIKATPNLYRPKEMILYCQTCGTKLPKGKTQYCDNRCKAGIKVRLRDLLKREVG